MKSFLLTMSNSLSNERILPYRKPRTGSSAGSEVKDMPVIIASIVIIAVLALLALKWKIVSLALLCCLEEHGIDTNSIDYSRHVRFVIGKMFGG